MQRLVWWLIAVLTAVSAGCMLASGWLAWHTLGTAQQESFNARFVLIAQRAAHAAERTLALGVPLTEQPPLAALLTREAALDPAIVGLGILSAQGDWLIGQRPPAHPSSLTPLSALTALTAPQLLRQQRQTIANDLGETVAQVQLDYDTSGLQAERQQLRSAVIRATLPPLLAVCAATVALGWLLARRLLRGSVRSSLRGQLTTLTAVLLSLGMLWIGWGAHHAAQALIQPDQLAKASAMARASAGLIERALAAGVPLGALQGFDAHTAALRHDNPEVAALALLAPDGRVLHGALSTEVDGAAQVRAAVQHAGISTGDVVLQLDPGVLARRLYTTLLDMAFLSAISLLMTLELLALALGTRGARALAAAEARQQRRANPAQRQAPDQRSAWRSTSAAAVRPALFLFMLTEELTRPFLPNWARQLAPTDSALSPEMLAGLPLVVFLAVVALLQWPLASWSQQHGRRKGFVLGSLLSAAGLALAAACDAYAGFLLARTLSAVGFALVFVSAQGAVIDGSGSADRARSLAQFVRAILVAGLCGPPLGGLVADYGGAALAFALCAGLALLAAAIAGWQLPADRPAPVPTTATANAPGLWQGALRQPGLLALLLGCALPAKLLLAALWFYLIPVALQDAGHSSAVIGRLQAIYPLTMVLLVPLAARWADRWQQRSNFVLIGGLLAGGSALLAWPAGTSPMVLALVLLGLGLGQALSIAPQSALVADFASRCAPQQSAAVLGLFRLIERSGSALGPASGALLLAAWGLGPALATIGAVAVGGSLAYGWQLRRAERAAIASRTTPVRNSPAP